MIDDTHGGVNLVQSIRKVLGKAVNSCSESSLVTLERTIVFRQVTFRVEAPGALWYLPVEERFKGHMRHWIVEIYVAKNALGRFR